MYLSLQLTYGQFPGRGPSVAAESDSTGQRLPHVAGPEVDAVGRQADHREDKVGTERHRLHNKKKTTEMKSGCVSVSFHSFHHRFTL